MKGLGTRQKGGSEPEHVGWREALEGNDVMIKEICGMVSEYLKTKEKETRNSTDSGEQGEWWEAKLDYGLGKAQVDIQGANQQVSLGKESLTSDG